MSFTVRALTPETWDAFADVCARNNGGGMGGCWCTWMHSTTNTERRAHGDPRTFKRELVDSGRTHAAVVFESEEAVGWCQYGSPAELPGITHRAQVAAPGDLPDYRITCFYVDRRHRGRGGPEPRWPARPADRPSGASAARGTARSRNPGSTP